MLSFMNMGGTRKKRRRSKKGTSPSSRDNTLAVAKRASLRDSASFMSPGDLGEAKQKEDRSNLSNSTAAAPIAVRKGRPNMDKELPILITYGEQRSPEIQLEFKHDSLLNSMPGEFLRNRNRKGSLASSAEDAMPVRPPLTHAPSGSTSTLEGSPRQKTGDISRRARRPSVAPIQIPATPVQTTPLQLKRRASRASRKSRSIKTSVNVPPSPAWASDSELDPVSAVSGVSAARDALNKSFSFSARTPATGFGFEESVSQEKKDIDLAFAKEMGHRMERQDSATLPRDVMWESAQETKSLSHKSSSQSLKKRKRDAVISINPLPPLEAFTSPKQDSRHVKTPIKESTRNDEQSPSAAPTRKDSLFRSRPRAPPRANPPPQAVSPSTQKLGYLDQLALSRMSRIAEGDTEASSGTGSPAFSPPSNRRFRKQKPSLSSPRTAPSTGGTSPSLYSNISSPHYSPGQKSGPPSSRTDSDLESFLEGFQISKSVSSPSFKHDQESFNSKSPRSPLYNKGSVPLSASTAFSSLGPPSSSFAGVFRTISEPPTSQRSDCSQPVSGSSTPSKAPSQTTNFTTQTKHTKSTAITSPTGSVPNSARGPKQVLRYQEDSSPSIASSTIKTPVTGSQSKGTAILLRLAEDAPSAENSPSIYSPLSPRVEVQSPKVGTPDSEKRRPSLPQLRVNSVMLSPSAISSVTSPGQSPGQSPDLLDMLIPNGHVVTPISRHRRAGSTPSPIKIVNTPQRYSPVNGDTIEEGLYSAGRRQSVDNAPSSGEYGRSAQTFPETPVLFSPELPQEVPPPANGRRRLSRSMSATSLKKFAFTRMNSLVKSASSMQPIVIPATPRIPVTLEEKSAESRAEKEMISPASPDSPPISPLEPPPSSLESPETSRARFVQVAKERKQLSPPVLAPAPKKKAVRPRPPLPFGPRKPSRISISKVSPLSFASKRKAASESVVGITQILSTVGESPQTEIDNPLASPTLGTPTFKTTPVRWRGLTLEAAQWTFTSAQLQDIVRHAIAKSSEASTMRLLAQDVVNDELPEALRTLEQRKADVESNYKVQVRRRRALLQRLATPRSNAASVVQLAEELAGVTAACDQLVEELHDICGQIVQINQLRDAHHASALATALRKLNTSLARQTEQARKLDTDLGNLYAEYEEAWRKVEEKDREILTLQEQLDSGPRSGTSSKRSSRASLALARRNSRRASEARMRLSGSSLNFGNTGRRQSQRSSRSSHSSLHVNIPTSQRATFTFAPGEGVPPVPPLPMGKVSSASRYSDATTAQTLGSSVLSTGLQSSDGLYHAVYDMLGVQGKDRAIPSPARPVSMSFEAGLNVSLDGSYEMGNSYGRDASLAAITQNAVASRSDVHLALPSRRGSLPIHASAHQDHEIPNPEAIIAMLDL